MNGPAMNCSKEGLTAICIHVISQKKDNSIFNIFSKICFTSNPTQGQGPGVWSHDVYINSPGYPWSKYEYFLIIITMLF